MLVQTVIQQYALGVGEVGSDIGPPVIVDHKDGATALVHLHRAIYANAKAPGAFRFHILFPDGQKLPLDAAYTRIFSESPVYRDNKRTLYPRLLPYLRR